MKKSAVADPAHGYMGIWCGMATEIRGEHMQFSADALCAYATGVRMLAVSQAVFSEPIDALYKTRVAAARELARADHFPATAVDQPALAVV